MQKACFSLHLSFHWMYLRIKQMEIKKYIRKCKTAFKMIDISSARECCATWCSFNNIIFSKLLTRWCWILVVFILILKFITPPPLTVRSPRSNQLFLSISTFFKLFYWLYVNSGNQQIVYFLPRMTAFFERYIEAHSKYVTSLS